MSLAIPLLVHVRTRDRHEYFVRPGVWCRAMHRSRVFNTVAEAEACYTGMPWDELELLVFRPEGQPVVLNVPAPRILRELIDSLAPPAEPQRAVRTNDLRRREP